MCLSTPALHFHYLIFFKKNNTFYTRKKQASRGLLMNMSGKRFFLKSSLARTHINREQNTGSAFPACVRLRICASVITPVQDFNAEREKTHAHKVTHINETLRCDFSSPPPSPYCMYRSRGVNRLAAIYSDATGGIVPCCGCFFFVFFYSFYQQQKLKPHVRR